MIQSIIEIERMHTMIHPTALQMLHSYPFTHSVVLRGYVSPRTLRDCMGYDRDGGRNLTVSIIYIKT